MDPSNQQWPSNSSVINVNNAEDRRPAYATQPEHRRILLNIRFKPLLIDPHRELVGLDDIDCSAEAKGVYGLLATRKDLEVPWKTTINDEVELFNRLDGDILQLKHTPTTIGNSCIVKFNRCYIQIPRTPDSFYIEIG